MLVGFLTKKGQHGERNTEDLGDINMSVVVSAVNMVYSTPESRGWTLAQPSMSTRRRERSSTLKQLISRRDCRVKIKLV